MGIDAQIVFTVPEALDAKAMNRLSFELASVFDFVHRDRSWDIRGVEPVEPDGVKMEPPPPEWHAAYAVSTWHSYYGDGYERGPLHHTLALAAFLKERLPGCLVYYGPDSSDTVRLLDEDACRKLWRHFVQHGHRPYFSDFGKTITCPFCDEPMRQMMWSHGRSGFYCDGCRTHEVVEDGGERYVTDKDFNRRPETGADT